MGPSSPSWLPLKPAAQRQPSPEILEKQDHEKADFQKPAIKGPTPRSRPLSRRLRSCPQSLHPHNGDKTGRGYSKACHPRIPAHAWPQCTVRGGHPRPARHCCHDDRDVTHGEGSVRPVGGGPPRSGRSRRRPGFPQSAKGMAGFQQPASSLPPRRCFIKETREGKATVMSRLAAAL